MEAWLSIEPIEYFLEEVEIINPTLQHLVDSIYLKEYFNREAVYQELVFFGLDTLGPYEDRYELSEKAVSLCFGGNLYTDSSISLWQDHYFMGLVYINDDLVVIRCNHDLFDDFFKRKNREARILIMPSYQVFNNMTFNDYHDFIFFEISLPSITFLFDGLRYLFVLKLGK